MFDPTITDIKRLGLELSAVDLENMSEQDLLLLRAAIDARLPITRLADMNLEQELTMQFRVAQALQANIVNNVDVAANQKAQVMNAVSANLQALAKMQAEHYTPERLKKIENILVAMLNGWPKEQAELFFQEYEKLLEEGGSPS